MVKTPPDRLASALRANLKKRKTHAPSAPNPPPETPQSPEKPAPQTSITAAQPAPGQFVPKKPG